MWACTPIGVATGPGGAVSGCRSRVGPTNGITLGSQAGWVGGRYLTVIKKKPVGPCAALGTGVGS